MMEVCSDAANSQTAKFNEFVLVAHRIRKAGRGGIPQIQTETKKRRERPSFLSNGREKLTYRQWLYCFGIARAQRSSSHTDLSPLWGNDL